MFRPLTLALAVLAAPATAQNVTGCYENSYENIFSPMNIPEPWDYYTRSFAEGAVRVVAIDLVEPHAVALKLMIMYPPYDELGQRMSCNIVGVGYAGWGNIAFDEMTSTYDPASGLTLTVPVSTMEFGGTLSMTINQDSGTMTADIDKFELLE
jgi:hypothetical protein